MKTITLKKLLVAITLTTSAIAAAQQHELTIKVEGIKEVKGNILIAVKSCENSQEPIYDKIAVGERSITHTIKNINTNCIHISVFQDVNENYKLDFDEQNIPTEPCFSKENIKIKEGDNKLTVKLINVKELMGTQKP